MAVSATDPQPHLAKIRQELKDVARHTREDVAKAAKPQARALLETTVEVLNGLARAYEHAEQGSEPAWQ